MKNNILPPKDPSFDLMWSEVFSLSGVCPDFCVTERCYGCFALLDIVTSQSSLNDCHQNLWVRANGPVPPLPQSLQQLWGAHWLLWRHLLKDLVLGFEHKLFQEVLLFFVVTFKTVLKKCSDMILPLKWNFL